MHTSRSPYSYALLKVLLAGSIWAGASLATAVETKSKSPAKGFAFHPQPQPVQALAKQFISGTYQCEFNETVTVKVRNDHPGYIDLTFHKHTHHMLPIVTDTGALRAESAQEGGVWLQLPSKAMLMNSKKGQRLADDCHLK